MPANLNNNSFATATDITTTAGSSPLTGSLSATGGDLVDYYRFSLSSGSNLKIVLNGLTGDAKLSLYRRTDSAVATDSDLVQNLPTNNQGRLSDVIVLNEAAAVAGTYYLKVDLGPSAPSADYNLSVVSSGSDFSGGVLWRNQAGNFFAPWKIQDTTVVGAAPRTIPNAYTLTGSGDFDGNGASDLLWRYLNPNDPTNNGQIYVWWTQDGITEGTGSQTPIKDSLGRTILVGQEWVIQALKDLDGNGTSDILWRNLASGDVVTWLLGKDATTGGPTISGGAILNQGLGFSLPEAAGWDIVGVNNVDGQYGSDVLWINRFSNQVAIWTLTGTSILDRPVLPIRPPLDYKVIGFTDVTGDGNADILWRSEQRNQLVIWKMNGNAREKDITYTVPSTYKVVATKDLDGDGISDLLWRNTSNGAAITYGWLMGAGTDGLSRKDEGQITRSNGSIPAPGAAYEVLGIQDFDGRDNTTSHILWRGSGGDVYIWKMNGLTLIEDKQLAGTGIGAEYQLPSLNYGAYKEPQFGSVQLTSQFQTIGGSSSVEAFDIGVLNNKGTYVDTVSNRSNKTDWYKFKVLQSTDFKASDDNTSVSLELFKADANGNLTTTSVPYPTEGAAVILETGTYYLKVNAGGSSNGLLPYTLNIEGVPRTIDVFGTNFRLAETSATTAPTDNTTFSTELPNVTNTQTPEKKTVRSFLTIKNGGTVKTGSFKVKYYLSRTATIDPGNTSTILLKTVDVTNGVDPAVAGSQDPNTGTITLTEDLVLPDGQNVDPKKFWTRDAGTYYIGAVIDADDSLVEGAEGELNNSNRGNFLDSSSFVANNVQVFELVGQSFSLANPTVYDFVNNSFFTVNYSVQNQGRRAITDNNKFNIQFVLSKDNIIGNSDDSILASEVAELGNLPGSTSSGPGTSGPQTRTIFLPDSGDAFWNQYSGGGTQTVYIGMRIDSGNLIEESVEDNNFSQGLGIDFASFQMNLSAS